MKKILYLLFLTFCFRADICFAQSATNCATAGTIECGTNFTGTTAGAGNDFNASDFPCNQTNSPFNGNDRVYKVSVTTSGYHTFKLTELNADLDIFLLTNACENGAKIKDACIDFSANPGQNDEIIGPIYLEEGAPYYLIIDAFDASITSTFRIQVQCPAVSTTNFCTPSANVRPLTLKDNFEAYTLGNVAPQSSKWRLWDFNSGDGLVSNDRSFSGSKSLKIQSTNPPSDVIYQMGYLDQGRYRISWKMYIPSGKTSYYNLLHKYDNPEHWAYHVYFSENGKGQVNNYNILTDISFTYEYNKWFSVTQIVDISSDKVELFIAGKYIASWKFSNSSNPNSYNNKLAGINFAAVKSSDQFYVDDICIRRAGCFDCILTNQKVCMYPGNEMDKCLAGCAGYEEEEWTAGNCTPTNSGNCPECFQCFTWRKGTNENEIFFDNNYCEEQVLGYSDKLESRNAVTYDWDFGSESVTFLEGTNRNSQNPRCKFPRPGKFKICFKVYRSNTLLFECCKIVHINPCSKPPVPQLTYTINETNGEVQFDASATTDAEVYEWDFGGGDALITHDTKPKRRYQNGRCYTVCYYASNGCGTSKICITVCPGYSPCMNRPLPPKAPVPNFNITDDVLQISGLSQGEYEKIEWILPSDISFEAGSTVNTWNPKCKFKKPGYHTICAIIFFKCHKVCFCWTVYYPGCCTDRCKDAEELQCGTVYKKTTINEKFRFNINDYPCHQISVTYGASDKIFKYKHTDMNKNANVVMWGHTKDLDLFLIKDCGTPLNCIKKSTRNGTEFEWIDFTGLPYGDYYIIVDGYQSDQVSNFNISIACQYICINGLGESLECGKAVSGTTVGGVNYFHKYGCTNTFEYTGNEKLYHFTAPDDGNYTIDLTGFTGDMDLFILKSEFNCNTLPVCIESSNNEAGKNEQKIIQLKKGEHIDIIVDGSLGNNSAFTLKVSCPNPVTNNCPDCFQCFTWRKGSNENEIYFDNNYCEDFIPVLNSLESRSAVTYQWDFAGENVTFLEGTNRNSQHPKCKFPRAGRYKICLKVFRGSSLLFECCKTIIINPCTKPPVPQLTYSINESNGEVQFDASATSEAESYEWDFGGGTDVTVSDTKPKRRYPGGRCYTVCLYTSNGCGTSKICITVCPGYSPCMNRPIPPKAPVPNFTITDDILQISGNTQGEYEKIEWTLPADISFEAGSTVNTWNPKLKFKKPGYHTICAIIYFKCHKVCFCWTVYYPDPGFCPLNYDPVCVNGREFSNECFARKAGFGPNDWVKGPCIQASTLTFDLDDAVCGTVNNIVRIPLRVKNFKNIRSFQFTVELTEPSKGTLLSVEKGNIDGELNSSIISNTAGIIWDIPQAIDILDNQIIAYLNVRIQSSFNSNSDILLNGKTVNVYAEDGTGKSITPILIKGNYCVSSSFSISGKIVREDGIGIQSVTVTINGPLYKTTTTDVNGNYSFTDINIPGDYVIKPVKDINYKNGVNTGDVSAIRRHILKTELLNSPYKIIAADAKNPVSINTGDVSELRQLILGNISDFPERESWTFIDKAFKFSDPTNPFSSAYPTTILRNITNSVSGIDFIGVKIGDVTNDNNPANADIPVIESRSTITDLFLIANDMAIGGNQKFSINITVKQFQNIRAGQFSLNWDKDVAVFESIVNIHSALGPQNALFNTSMPGKLGFIWDTESQVTMPDNSILFTVNFKSLTKKASTSLNFTSDPVDIYFEDKNGKAINVLTQNSTVNVPYKYQTELSTIKLFPNPANSILYLKGPGSFKVIGLVDISGKKLKVHYYDGFDKINLSEVKSGVYFIQILVGEKIESHKIIVAK